jgi:hypothetical protein
MPIKKSETREEVNYWLSYLATPEEKTAVKFWLSAERRADRAGRDPRNPGHHMPDWHGNDGDGMSGEAAACAMAKLIETLDEQSIYILVGAALTCE